MFEETKQKVMVGALGVLVLGMGGYWLVFADDGKPADSAILVSIEPTQPRVSEVERPRLRGQGRQTEEVIAEANVRPDRPVREEIESPTSRRPVDPIRSVARAKPKPGC